jgi:hypothetical protein
MGLLEANVLSDDFRSLCRYLPPWKDALSTGGLLQIFRTSNALQQTGCRLVVIFCPHIYSGAKADLQKSFCRGFSKWLVGNQINVEFIS